MSKLTDQLRAVKCINQWDFYGDQPYLYYRPRGDARSMQVPGWLVFKRGVKLEGHWMDHGARWFHTKRNAPEVAQAWAAKQFKIKAWARDPWGGYGPADYVTTRLQELLALLVPPPAVPLWKQGPQAAEVWRRTDKGHDGKRRTETRTVVDRTLGGDVVFVQGKVTRFAQRSQCSFTDWSAWCGPARQVSR
jgi:hypothetical protein